MRGITVKKNYYRSALFLALLSILLFSMSSNAFAADYDIAMTGSGTQGDPYIITSKYQLSDKSEYNIFNDLSAHYKLGNDIVFSADDYAEGGYFHYFGSIPQAGVSAIYGLGFEPIGDREIPFTGVFDGDGHSITGLYIEYDGNFSNVVGLFGYVVGGKVENLNLVDVDISTKSTVEMFTGGIVGLLQGGTVTNCTVSGEVEGDSNTGGIVGEVSGGGSVGDVINRASVTGVASPFLSTNGGHAEVALKVGGIVGSSEGAAVDGATNAGSVRVDAAGGGENSFGSAGGIVGHGEHSSITNSENSGDITASDRSMTSYPLYVTIASGGIVGSGDMLTIASCVNTADVLTYNSSEMVSACYAGGIIGTDIAPDFGAGGQITRCSNSGSVEVTAREGATAMVGGIAGGTGATLESCKNEGKVLGSTSNYEGAIDGYAGGVAGLCVGTVNSCYNVGEVYSWGYARVPTENILFEMELRTGGVVGYVQNGVVSNSYNTGNITVGNYQPSTVSQDESQVFSGGVVGYLVGSYIYNCYNRGDIDSLNPSGNIGGGVGGVVGNGIAYVEALYSSTSNDIVSTVVDNTNGFNFNDYNFTLTDAEMEESASFGGFSFGDVWVFDRATAYLYPELASFTDYTPESESYDITGIQVIGIKAPAKGESPSAAMDAVVPIGAKYTVAELKWHGSPTVFYGDTVYSADITLNANSGFTFGSDLSFLLSGAQEVTQKSLSPDGAVLVLSVTYSKLLAPVIEKLSAEGGKVGYYVDESFDQRGIVVKGVFDDTSVRALEPSEYYFEQTSFEIPEYVGVEGYTHTVLCISSLDADINDSFNVSVTKRAVTADDFEIILPTDKVANGEPKEVEIEIVNEIVKGDAPYIEVFYSDIRDHDFEYGIPSTDPPTEAGVYYIYIAVEITSSSIYNSVPKSAPIYIGSFTVLSNGFDLDGNGKIDVGDLREIARAENYNRSVGQEGVDEAADINKDGKVNFLDLAMLRNSKVFGS